MYPQALIFLLALLSQTASIAGPPSPEVLRQELLARFNQERAAAGAAPLSLAGPLNLVAQENAREIQEKGGVVYDEKSIPAIQRRLRKSGYEAHGWHQAFAAGPDDPTALLAWIKAQYPETFQSLMNADYQELGIGISEIKGTPLYTFFLAWRESESFARQTAGLTDPARVRAEMLARVNAERAAAGQPPLSLESRLNAAAQSHAEDMLLRSYYSHASLEGSGPGDRVRKSGYTARMSGENIARGPLSVAEAMDNWMASQEHRRNLLHSGFTELGVGVAVGRNSVGYTVLWVQDFGRPAT
ncbi:MAG TPA: CAP domain-containing protein [Thermoanaerobaculia bacterium]|nr:CAP domain-containing protein [Thermoanaerobaculia bacterium]